MSPGYMCSKVSFSPGNFPYYLSLSFFRHLICYMVESGVKNVNKKSHKESSREDGGLEGHSENFIPHIH